MKNTHSLTFCEEFIETFISTDSLNPQEKFINRRVHRDNFTQMGEAKITLLISSFVLGSR